MYIILYYIILYIYHIFFSLRCYYLCSPIDAIELSETEECSHAYGFLASGDTPLRPVGDDDFAND